MRALLLLALLLAPAAAAAWSVGSDAPAAAEAGVPFAFEACVTGPANASAQLKAHLTLAGRTVAGSSRYGEAFALGEAGRACREVRLEPADVEGNASLLLRVRPAGRDGAVAERVSTLVLARSEPPPLRIAGVYAAPYAGVVLRNDGDAPAPLLGLALAQGTRAWPLPDVVLEPGARLFLGPRAPPVEPAAAPLDVAPRAGNLTLVQGKRVLDVLGIPSLARGTLVDDAGARVLGRTRVAPEMRDVGPLVVYATPEAGAAVVVDLIEGATREVLLTGYTMTSADVGAALARAARRGVDVRVLLEGAPVGGVPEDEARLLAALVEAGATVDLLRSTPDFPTRYRNVHAKTIVVDEARVLVATENLHDSSYPPLPSGAGTRGFGVVAHDASLAALFADVFRQDAAPWPDVQRAEPASLPPPRALVPAAGARPGPTLEVTGARAAPVLSPDASMTLVDALAGAERSIDAAVLFAEPDWGREPNPFLEALVEAARRGARVRLLLDGNVDAGRNAVAADALNALARAERLPLEARVDDAPRTLHAKVAVVDGRASYVGSMNWGRASARDNREAALLVESDEVASFLLAVFEEDWALLAEEAPPPRRESPAPAVWLALALAGLARGLRRSGAGAGRSRPRGRTRRRRSPRGAARRQGRRGACTRRGPARSPRSRPRSARGGARGGRSRPSRPPRRGCAT